jgi:hypothetical protein
MGNKKVPANKTLAWGIKKYGRWIRIYVKQIRAIESFMGGMLYPC